MTEFPSGVTVVTSTDADGRHYGLTLSAFCSFSADPPSVLVCVDRSSNTLPAIRETGRFTVNFLDAAHSGLARHFASKDPEKFADLPVRPGDDHGGPILHEHACAYLQCRVTRQIAVDDHVILIAHVDHGAIIDGRRPLVYGARRFGAWDRTTPIDDAVASTA